MCNTVAQRLDLNLIWISFNHRNIFDIFIMRRMKFQSSYLKDVKEEIQYCQLKSWKMLFENSSIHSLLARCSSNFNRSIMVAWRIYTSFECSWTYCAKTLKLWLSLVTFKFGHNSSMRGPLNIFVNSIVVNIIFYTFDQ